MHAGVHADSVAGTRLYTKPAENAAQLVDDEDARVALVTTPFIALSVLGRLDVNALRWAGGRAAQARDATGRAIVAHRQAVQAAEAVRVRAALLGVFDRRDPAFEVLENGIALLAKHALLRVLEEMPHGHRRTLQPFGHVRLNLGRAVGTRDNLRRNR